LLPLVRAGKQLRDPGREGADAFAAARPGADQHQAAHQLRAGEGDLLGDQAAHRVPDHVDRVQAERVDEADRVAGHRLDGVGHSPAGGRHPGVVEQDDLAVAGEGVAQGRVVVIQGAHEVLEKHQRRTTGHPETAVGETYPAALGVLGGRRVMRERSHDASVPPGRVPGVSVT
jgi:hypothetical protein